MSCMKCHHAHIPSNSPTPSHMLMSSVTIVTSSTNDTHVLSPYRLTSTQCKYQWATNPESIPTPITQLEVYVITITVCILFGKKSFSDYTAGLLHPTHNFSDTPRVSHTHTEHFRYTAGLLHPHRAFRIHRGSLTPMQNFLDTLRVSHTHIRPTHITCHLNGFTPS